MWDIGDKGGTKNEETTDMMERLDGVLPFVGPELAPERK